MESVPSDYLDPDFRELCEEIISGQIANNAFVEAYLIGKKFVGKK